MTDTHVPDAPAVAWECTAAKLPWGPGARAVVERDQDPPWREPCLGCGEEG